VDRDAFADEARHDLGLQIRKGEHEIRLKCYDLGNVSAGKCRNAWLLFSNAGRPHGIARDADNASILFKEIERFDGLFRQMMRSGGKAIRTGPTGTR
jgi:hypothetical protein